MADDCQHVWESWFTQIDFNVSSGSGLRCKKCGKVLTLDDVADILNGEGTARELALPGPEERKK